MVRLAREHGINDNLLFNWRHQYKQGKLNRADNLQAELLPVSFVTPSAAPAPLTPPLPADVLCCEVALPGGTVKLHGAVIRVANDAGDANGQKIPVKRSSPHGYAQSAK